MAKRWTVVALLALYVQLAFCGLGVSDHIRVLGPQAVNLWKLQQNAAHVRSQAQPQVQGSLRIQGKGQDYVQPQESLKRTFLEHWFYQPLDHFAGEGERTENWKQRYWVNTRHYVPGPNAPVIVIDGGETNGEERLGFLDTGIADILARATGGVGVVLEHRCVSLLAIGVRFGRGFCWNLGLRV